MGMLNQRDHKPLSAVLRYQQLLLIIWMRFPLFSAVIILLYMSISKQKASSSYLGLHGTPRSLTQSERVLMTTPLYWWWKPPVMKLKQSESLLWALVVWMRQPLQSRQPFHEQTRQMQMLWPNLQICPLSICLLSYSSALIDLGGSNVQMQSFNYLLPYYYIFYSNCTLNQLLKSNTFSASLMHFLRSFLGSRLHPSITFLNNYWSIYYFLRYLRASVNMKSTNSPKLQLSVEDFSYFELTDSSSSVNCCFCYQFQVVYFNLQMPRTSVNSFTCRFEASCCSRVFEKNSCMNDFMIYTQMLLYYLVYSIANITCILYMQVSTYCCCVLLASAGRIMFVTALQRGQYIFYFYLVMVRKHC